MDEVEFTSAQSPASNFYTVNNIHTTKRSPNASLNRDVRKRDPGFITKERADAPAPGAYKASETAWKQTSPYKSTNFNYSIPKKKDGSFIDQHVKKKKAVPGCNVYKIKDSVMDKIYTGPQPRYKRGR